MNSVSRKANVRRCLASGAKNSSPLPPIGQVLAFRISIARVHFLPGFRASALDRTGCRIACHRWPVWVFPMAECQGDAPTDNSVYQAYLSLGRRNLNENVLQVLTDFIAPRLGCGFELGSSTPETVFPDMSFPMRKSDRL